MAVDRLDIIVNSQDRESNLVETRYNYIDTSKTNEQILAVVKPFFSLSMNSYVGTKKIATEDIDDD